MSYEKVREMYGYFTGQTYSRGICKVYELFEGSPDKDFSNKEYNDPVHFIEKSAFDELMQNARALRDSLVKCDCHIDLVESFDKKYPQLNEKE